MLSKFASKHFLIAYFSIFENKEYVDPDGLLPLSVKQMEKLKYWQRAVDMIPTEQLVNGMPDIATDINGYEVS